MSDQAYLSKIASIMHDAQALPQDHHRYFEPYAEAQDLPVERIRPSRLREEGVLNAVGYMREAAAGARKRRSPIRVSAAGNGTWRVIDGNSTFAVAAYSGWSSIPCLVEQDSSDSTRVDDT